MDSIATILATRTVTSVVVGTKKYPLPAGTTNVTAMSRSECVIPFSTYTWGYAGPEEDSTMVVVQARIGRGSVSDGFRAAAKTLATRIARIEKGA